MERGEKVVVYDNEYSVCSGCRSCEILCSVMHDGVYSPERPRIKFEVDNLYRNLHHIYSCQQCDDHPCYDACPLQDKAMCIDGQTGVVYVDQDACIGCGKCVKACPFDPARIHILKRGKKRVAVKCDLCRGIPEGPICINNCPAMKLGLVADSNPDLTAPKGWVITPDGAKQVEECAASGTETEGE